MNPSQRKTLIAIGAIVMLVALLVIGVYAVGFAALFGVFRHGFDHADYEDMVFSGENGEFYAFGINSYRTGSPIPQVYIRGVTDKVWYLPELSEADVAAIAHEELSGNDLDGRHTARYHFGKSGFCRFTEGELIEFGIGADDGFRIGVRRNGEFVKLPIDKRTMIQVFGRPKRYRKSYERPV